MKFHPEINGVFVLPFSDMIQGDAGMATCGPSIKANTGESSWFRLTLPKTNIDTKKLYPFKYGHLWSLY